MLWGFLFTLCSSLCIYWMSTNIRLTEISNALLEISKKGAVPSPSCVKKRRLCCCYHLSYNSGNTAQQNFWPSPSKLHRALNQDTPLPEMYKITIAALDCYFNSNSVSSQVFYLEALPLIISIRAAFVHHFWTISTSVWQCITTPCSYRLA